MQSATRTLARRLGVYDAALIVMGGIIGTGIFRNPSVVAKYVHTPALILTAWTLGGVIALLGAFIFAELAARRPSDGGLYAYMRDAYHPVVAFMYGWTLLLVSQSGGAASAAITFGGYVAPLLPGVPVSAKFVGVATLALLTVVNCLGVRAGANFQNLFMVLKIAALAMLIGVGVFARGHAVQAVQSFSGNGDALMALGIAMVPVLFAYSGWQTSSFMSGELKDPQRTLPRGMLWGVAGVVAIYMLVNIVSLHALGANGLMNTDTPAADVMRTVLGPFGAQLISWAVMLSTFGFMTNQILTAPRVYHAMGEDGVFFKIAAWVHPRTRVPVIAIALQGTIAIVMALWLPYNQLLNYVTSIDYVFFALSALALFVFRARDKASGSAPPLFRVPGHPFSTLFFLLVAVAVVLDTYYHDPRDSFTGLGILLVAVPVYFIFLARRFAALAKGEN